MRELAAADNRMEMWTSFLRKHEIEVMAEVGVYRGHFAARMLDGVASLRRYYMIDPWRHLADWDKPANKPNDIFEGFYAETLAKTAAHAAKRIVLRGRTVEVADEIPDGALDFAYIDGDHTLRGITVDLLRIYPKIRDGGFIAGDDFNPDAFHHGRDYEPTMVFPYTVHFAEAKGLRIYALPHHQFLIPKTTPAAGFGFVEVADGYRAMTIKQQVDRLDARMATQPAPPEPRARRTARRLRGWTRGMMKPGQGSRRHLD